jgi:hypothetical protein
MRKRKPISGRVKYRKPPRRWHAAAKAAEKRAMKQWYGSHGAASPVRRIDPVTGEVIETIPAKIG